MSDRYKIETIRFRVDKLEKELIKKKAQEVGLENNISEYIRRAVFRRGMRNKYETDLEMNLIKLNADQARLGNLFNQWLKSNLHYDLTLTFKLIDTVKKALELTITNQELIKAELDYLRNDRLDI